VPEPTTARGAATSRRILDAAREEFAERGIAGARVDRITAAARTNKAQVYGYFGSKDGLFEAVLADVRQRGERVPFDVDDLPGWAVGLYDAHLRNRELFRLMAWARLEQRPVGFLLSEAELEPKINAVADAQAAGRLRSGDPADLLLMVFSLASAWSPFGGIYAAAADEPAAAHERRRTLLREAVAQILR
jgi:AcrR family transcriptional regulator